AANTGPITRICMASLQVSNTVAVLFHKDKCPTTVAEAAEVFATIGDVARLDMSLGTTVGLLFVTFYDVRVAQRVVQHTKPFAWPAQAGMDDFRAVSWSSSQFANLPRQERGFERFGEIARIFSCGGDIIIEFYDMRAEWPLLVVAPSSLRFVWRDQAAQWLPHLVGDDGQDVHVVRNSKDKVCKSAKLVVCTYDLLRRCERLRRRSDGRDYLVVVVDESQSIKESTSQRTKVVVGICKAARRVVLLSGTPAVNRASELYTQLEALMPSEMPSFSQFAERYSYKQTLRFGGRTTVKWNGAQRPAELNSLLGSVMIRRLKKDVLQQLPAKRRMKVPLDPESINQESCSNQTRAFPRFKKHAPVEDFRGFGPHQR
ncbi:unnamed protein product, partial [Durusdinium trenchii]